MNIEYENSKDFWLCCILTDEKKIIRTVPNHYGEQIIFPPNILIFCQISKHPSI